MQQQIEQPGSARRLVLGRITRSNCLQVLEAALSSQTVPAEGVQTTREVGDTGEHTYLLTNSRNEALHVSITATHAVNLQVHCTPQPSQWRRLNHTGAAQLQCLTGRSALTEAK